MRLVLALVLATCVCGISLGEEEAGTVVGAGWVPCAEFAQKYRQDPQSTESYFFAWAQGYMSGVNYAALTRKNLRGWRIEQQKQHIRTYCDEHPLANVAFAVQDLLDNLPSR